MAENPTKLDRRIVAVPIIGNTLRCVFFLATGGRSSNGRTPDSGSGYLGSNPSLPANLFKVRPGDIGDRSYRRHRLHFWAKRVVERLQSFFLQIDVAEIVLHKADQPNTFFDFFDPQGLSCEDRAEINFFAVQTDASAVGDMNDAVVKRISKFWQATIPPHGRTVDFPASHHVQALLR